MPFTLRSRFFACCLLASTASLANAQRADTSRARTELTSAQLDSLRTPIGPRRAFFYSFLVPGYSQSVLGRHKAATLFMFVEALAIGMIRESAADVHEARRTVNDTLILSYTEANGEVTRAVGAPRFNSAYVRTREAHVEDWVALLVANHLFAGADAYVGANLWDVPARLGLRRFPRGTMLTASFRW